MFVSGLFVVLAAYSGTQAVACHIDGTAPSRKSGQERGPWSWLDRNPSAKQFVADFVQRLRAAIEANQFDDVVLPSTNPTMTAIDDVTSSWFRKTMESVDEQRTDVMDDVTTRPTEHYVTMNDVIRNRMQKAREFIDENAADVVDDVTVKPREGYDVGDQDVTENEKQLLRLLTNVLQQKIHRFSP